MSEQTNGAYRPRCRHLCCKSMMVYGESFEMDPEYQAGLTEFWCVLTAKGQGPDGNSVSLEDCTAILPPEGVPPEKCPQRACFKEY